MQAMDEKNDMDVLKANNMRLLTNILPTHVAEHFLKHQVIDKKMKMKMARESERERERKASEGNTMEKALRKHIKETAWGNRGGEIKIVALMAE